MSKLERLREERLRRQIAEYEKKKAELVLDVKAAAGSDPEAARAARERIERRDRETAQQLAEEYAQKRRRGEE